MSNIALSANIKRFDPNPRSRRPVATLFQDQVARRYDDTLSLLWIMNQWHTLEIMRLQHQVNDRMSRVAIFGPDDYHISLHIHFQCLGASRAMIIRDPHPWDDDRGRRTWQGATLLDSIYDVLNAVKRLGADPTAELW